MPIHTSDDDDEDDDDNDDDGDVDEAEEDFFVHSIMIRCAIGVY